MSAYIYKNLLIIGRECTDARFKELLALRNWGLPAPKPFEYRSPDDKVILCYSGPVSQSNMTQIQPAVRPPLGEQEGAIHLLCDGTNIKVSGCMFLHAPRTPIHLTSLKDYLNLSVSNASSGTVLTLHWSPHLINDSTKAIIMQAGLLTDSANLTHKITKVAVPSFGFGTKPSTTFSTQPSTTFGAFKSGSFWK